VRNTRSFTLMKQRTVRILVILLVILSSTVLIDKFPASGAAAINEAERASRTLEGLDKNLTLTMLSQALTQLNNSLSSEPEDARLDKDMAKNTIYGLRDQLSVRSNGLNLDSYDEKICVDNPYDCDVADLKLALISIDHGSEKYAVQILKQLYNRTS
jgi:hypothetical protein